MDGHLQELAQLTINTVLYWKYKKQTKERRNKQSKDSCKGKASKQMSPIRLKNSLPVYFLWGHFNVSALAKNRNLGTWATVLH